MRGSSWLVAAGLLVGAVQSRSSDIIYRDPKNRFTLAVPAGWKVRALSDSVQIVRGDAYASVLIFEHVSDAASLVENLSEQMGKKWRRFEPAGHGEATLAGQKASAISISGANAQGVEAILRLVGTTSGDRGYVFVTGCPKSELPRVQETLRHVEASFTLLETRQLTAEEPEKTTLGMEVTDLAAADATVYGLSDPSGALVIQLLENGPAQHAGVELHDVVVTADGQNIDSAAMLQQVLKSHHVGELLELELLQVGEDGKVTRRTVRVKIGSTAKLR